MAYLGSNITESVKRDENAGKGLKHDFVVLARQEESGVYHWAFKLTAPAEADAIIFITNPSDARPIQAVRGPPSREAA